jgi:hypothetical protein
MKRILTLAIGGLLLAGCASQTPTPSQQASRDFSDAPQLKENDPNGMPHDTLPPEQVAMAPAQPAAKAPATRPGEDVIVNRPTRPRDARGKPIEDAGERPGPENTGVQDQKNLKRAMNIEAEDGQVIENMFIVGQVECTDKKNITIRNCVIDANGDRYGVHCQRSENILIEKCEIYNVGSAGVYGDGFTARYCQVSQSKGDGFKPGNNCVVDKNYVHTLGLNSPGAHSDGVQIRGAKNVKVIGNFFDMPINQPNTHSNSSVFIQGDKPKQRPTEDVLVEGNWCRGGNFTIQAFSDGGDASTIKIVNNRFFQGESRYGCAKLENGVVWNGNVFDGTGAMASPAAK